MLQPLFSEIQKTLRNEGAVWAGRVLECAVGGEGGFDEGLALRTMKVFSVLWRLTLEASLPQPKVALHGEPRSPKQ